MRYRMPARVAIILVNYNTFEDTKECVLSLLKIEEMNNCQIVVVDNCSTNLDDDAIEFIRKNTVYLQSKENIGFSGGNNIGIRWALSNKYDYVLLLNNDTIVKSNFLKELFDGIKNKSNVGAAIGKIYYYHDKNLLWYAGGRTDYNIGMVYQIGYEEQDVGQYDVQQEAQFATGCMMLIPCKVIKEIGFLEESFFLYAEDLEYSLRLQKKGYSIYYIPSSVIYHKVGSSSGKINVSFKTQYYNVRNTIRCFNMYQNFLQKLLTIIYQTLRYSKYIVLRRYDPRAVFLAYKDLLMKNTGKFEDHN